MLLHFHRLVPRYLSPGEIKNDNSLKDLSYQKFCNHSFSPSNFQYHSISFFILNTYGNCLYSQSFMGFQPAQFINKRPMGHIAHTEKTVQINKHILLYHNFDKKIREEKKIINLMRIYWFSIWRNLDPLHPRILCAKFGWNWSGGSGEEDFLISSMYFHNFVNISPWKRAGPFNWRNLKKIFTFS